MNFTEQKVLDTLCQHRFLWQILPKPLTSLFSFLFFYLVKVQCVTALAASGCPDFGSQDYYPTTKSGRFKTGRFYAFSLVEKALFQPPAYSYVFFCFFFFDLSILRTDTVPLIDRSQPPSVYSLPPFCLHRSSVLPEDQGTRRAAAPEGGGPVEGRQIGRVNWAGAPHAQIHRAQHHRQVSPQQHGGEPATQRTAQKALT